jgi:hypothetical protein
LSGASQRADLIRLAAVAEVLLGVAVQIDGDIVTETLLEELHGLRDRSYAALQELKDP